MLHTHPNGTVYRLLYANPASAVVDVSGRDDNPYAGNVASCGQVVYSHRDPHGWLAMQDGRMLTGTFPTAKAAAEALIAR